MKLFEMFNSDEQQGRVNIKKIVEASRKDAGATLLAGTELVILEADEVKEVYSLYETALEKGTEEEFVSSLGKQLNESPETLDHILKRFPKEVKDFQAGNELDEDLYHALFDYYNLHGEMPYGVAKARTGDPFEWVTQQLDSELGGGFGVHDADRPAEAAAASALNGIFDSLHEALDMNLLKAAQGAMGKTAKDPESERNVGKKYGYRSDKVSDDDDNYDEWGNEKPGKKKRVAPAAEPTEKRGRGRPRTRPLPDANAPKRGRGRPRKNPLPDPTAPKRGRGRPKKVREWIDSLRLVAEGYNQSN